MKKILQRIRNKKGESLVESLVSILIFTLASVLLLTMVSSASRINTTVKDEDEEFMEQQKKTELMPENGDRRTITIQSGDRALGTVEAYVVEQGPIVAVFPVNEDAGGAE